MPDQQVDLTEASQPERSIVEFRLETELAYFESMKTEFLEDLARVFDITPEELSIVSISRGCVNLQLEMPESSRRQLEHDLMYGDSPELKALRQKYSISRIRPNPRPEAPYLNLSGRPKTPENSLTWLHLSDVHFRSDQGSSQFAQNFVLDRFHTELPGFLAEWELKPDFVFLTGDISFSGQQNEYEGAKNFLSHLVNEQLLNSPKLLFVPGNHDISWDMIDPIFEKEIETQLDSHDAVNKYWIELDRQKQIGLLRFKNFFDFSRDCYALGQPDMNENEYYYVKKFEHGGLNIGISGLNSSWRSTRKDMKSEETSDVDMGNLILGQHQLVSALDAIRDTDLRIALLHHPPASMWFKEFDVQIQNALLPGFDFILRGHEHTMSALGISGPGAGCMHIASGSLYDHQGYPNGFNAVRLDLDSGKGCIFLWRYYKEAFTWRKDVVLFRDGFCEFDFPRPLGGSLVTT